MAEEFEESDILFREKAEDYCVYSSRLVGELQGKVEEEFVPPHVFVRRRVAGKVMAFSLCSGNGRTLKGRDLSDFRNSILRMTGFLET